MYDIPARKGTSRMTRPRHQAEESPWPRWRTRAALLGHRLDKSSDAWDAVGRATLVILLWMPPADLAVPFSSPAYWAAFLLTAGCILAAWLTRQHSRLAVCDPCLSDATSLPVMAEVRRYRRRLRDWHEPHYSLLRRLSTIALALSIPVALVIAWIPDGSRLTGQLVGTGLILASSAVSWWYGRLGDIHQRLKPWCPDCHPRSEMGAEHATTD